MTLDDARNTIHYLFTAPQKEVVILFCDKRSLQNEFSPFTRCFSVKSDSEGAGIFLGGKKRR